MKKNWWTQFKKKSYVEMEDFILTTLSKILKIDKKSIISLGLSEDRRSSESKISIEGNLITNLIDHQNKLIEEQVSEVYLSQDVKEIPNPKTSKQVPNHFQNNDLYFKNLTILLDNKTIEVDKEYLVLNTPENLKEDLELVFKVLRLDYLLDKNEKYQNNIDKSYSKLKQLNVPLYDNVVAIKEEIKKIRSDVNANLKDIVIKHCRDNNLSKEQSLKFKKLAAISSTQLDFNLVGENKIKVPIHLKGKTKSLNIIEVIVYWDKNKKLTCKNPSGNIVDFRTHLTSLILKEAKDFYTNEFKLHTNKNETKNEFEKKIKTKEEEEKLLLVEKTVEKVKNTLGDIWWEKLLQSIESNKGLSLDQKLAILNTLPKKISLNLDGVIDIQYQNPNLSFEIFKKILSGKINEKTVETLKNLLSEFKKFYKKLITDPKMKLQPVNKDFEIGVERGGEWDWRDISKLNVILFGVEKLLIPSIEKTTQSFNQTINEEKNTIDKLLNYQEGVLMSKVDLLQNESHTSIPIPKGLNEQNKNFHRYEYLKGFISRGYLDRGFERLSFSDKINLPILKELVIEEYVKLSNYLKENEIPFVENRRKETKELFKDCYLKLIEGVLEKEDNWSNGHLENISKKKTISR